MGRTNAPLPRELALADAAFARVAKGIALLPAVTAENAAEERARLVALAADDKPLRPQWRHREPRVSPGLRRAIDDARRAAAGCEVFSLYNARLDELELELAMLRAVGDGRRVRPLALRRFGGGRTCVDVGVSSTLTVRALANAILAVVEPSPEQATLPAEAADGARSAAAILRSVARDVALDVQIRVEPRLAAAAATGERTVFLAARRFGVREVHRLAAHEVLGHLVAAANGRAQPLRLLELGTAESFADQEGVALVLEELAGVFDGSRLRTLAARVFATDAMHEGARFGEVVRALMRAHGLAALEAVTTAERAFRGGGVARDVGYLVGWLRVRNALRRGEATLDELRMGRVSVTAVPELRRLLRAGFVRPPSYRPSLVRSRSLTVGGTSRETSPPSLATSLTKFDAT